MGNWVQCSKTRADSHFVSCNVWIAFYRMLWWYMFMLHRCPLVFYLQCTIELQKAYSFTLPPSIEACTMWIFIILRRCLFITVKARACFVALKNGVLHFLVCKPRVFWQSRAVVRSQFPRMVSILTLLSVQENCRQTDGKMGPLWEEHWVF